MKSLILKTAFLIASVVVALMVFYGMTPSRILAPSTAKPRRRLPRAWVWAGLIAVAVLAAGAAAPAIQRLSPAPAPGPVPPSLPSPPAPETLWLSDFESFNEHIVRWRSSHVKVSPSPEHATHGRSSAQLTFQSGHVATFTMSGYLARSRAHRDWSGYQTLHLDVFNPHTSQERLIVQLRDGQGRLYKEDLFVPAGTTEHLRIPLADIGAYLDVTRIVELSLFQWKPRQATTFYVDAIRLEPGEAQPRHAAQAADPQPQPERREDRPLARAATVTPGREWQAAWHHGVEKLFRDPAWFYGNPSGPVRVSLARGEYEGVQVALIGGSEPATVAVSVEPLTHTAGTAQITEQHIEVRRVDYVKTKKPYYPVTYVGEWPDPLPRATTIDVPARQVQPVWITIGAHAQLPAGRYTGLIHLADDHGRSVELPLEVTVWDFTLPRTAHLQTAFDFYRFRMEKAYREFVPEGAAWDKRLDELEDRYYTAMLKYRLSPIWGVNPTKPRFAWDVKRYMDRGLGVFGIGTTGGSNGNNWPIDPVALEQAMVWYRQAAMELRFMRLTDQAYVYAYDEPSLGDAHAAQVMAALHQTDPPLKTLLVVQQAPNPDRHAEWLKDADILCIRDAAFNSALAERYRAMGKEIWMYVSSPSHPHPALVIDHPAIAHRIIPWMAWKVKAKGLLYWCVNFWEGDPQINPASFQPDENGNGFLFYPGADGPIPSIRLEALRDGIEDYEYLYLLRERLDHAKAKGNVDPAVVAQAEHLLNIDPKLVESLRAYAKDPELLMAARTAIATMIEALQ